jgi:hypothetical protein
MYSMTFLFLQINVPPFCQTSHGLYASSNIRHQRTGGQGPYDQPRYEAHSDCPPLEPVGPELIQPPQQPQQQPQEGFLPGHPLLKDGGRHYGSKITALYLTLILTAS